MTPDKPPKDQTPTERAILLKHHADRAAEFQAIRERVDADAQSLALKPDPRPRPKDPHESAATFARIRNTYGV